MPRIQIGKIEFEHFQGFTQKTVDFKYRDAKACGENGTGKTSLADGVYWGLYDKNSAGIKKFGIRPVITNHDSPEFGEPIRGLIVKVAFDLLINGTAKTFCKEQHEDVKEINGRTIYSYPNKYWIDGYAMPENEYKKAIENIMPSDIFKMLTDLDYFNNEKKFKWPERREVLNEMSGNIPQPTGHDGLIAKLNGHDIDAYKKTLTVRKKLYEDERHDNGVLINDKQKYLKVYTQTAGDSEIELQARREIAQEDVLELDEKIQTLRDSEKERQEGFENINKLTVLRLHRESIVKNQSGKLEDLNDEKYKLEQEHGDRTQALVAVSYTHLTLPTILLV